MCTKNKQWVSGWFLSQHEKNIVQIILHPIASSSVSPPWYNRHGWLGVKKSTIYLSSVSRWLCAQNLITLRGHLIGDKYVLQIVIACYLKDVQFILFMIKVE